MIFLMRMKTREVVFSASTRLHPPPLVTCFSPRPYSAGTLPMREVPMANLHI